MTKNEFFAKMQRVAIRFEEQHLEALYEFAKAENLLEAKQGDILKAYIKNRISQDNLDLQVCDLGALQIDSEGKARCRYVPIRKLVDTNNWTPNACDLCKKLRQDMAQLKTTLGEAPKPKHHAPLVIMAKKLETNEATINSLQKDISFYKRELGLKGSNLSQVATLENKVTCLTNQLTTLKEENKTLKEQLDRWNNVTINCPTENKPTTLIKCLTTCQQIYNCPFYGNLTFT